MNQTEQTRSFIQDFFSALDERAAERIRIAENCCYTGSMLAGTIRGAADVREHIANVAPFIDRIEIGRVVVEGSSGAVLARLQGLGGKTLGIIGFGRIGRSVAERARAFGMEILTNQRRPTPELYLEAGVSPVDLEDLLVRSDFVTIHVPATDGAELRFWQWYRIEDGYDGANITVSADGGPFALVTPSPDYTDPTITAFGGTPGFTGDAGWHEVALLPLAELLVRGGLADELEARGLGMEAGLDVDTVAAQEELERLREAHRIG